VHERLVAELLFQRLGSAPEHVFIHDPPGHIDGPRRTGALGGFTPEGAAAVGVDGVRHGADDAYEFFWRLLYTF